MRDNRVVQAERDAEAARANLERSLDELRGRLTPGSLLDETLDYARAGGAGQFVRTLGRQVRNNPIPVTLVGAGLAWLMMARREHRVSELDLETRYRSAEDGATTDTDFGVASAGSSLASKTAQAMSGVGDTVSSAQDQAEAAYGRAADAASRTTDRLRRGAHDAADRAASLGRKASDGVTRLIEEQPLLLGALGLAVGAALASAFPGTRAEDRLVGSASDDLKQQAKDTLKEQANKAMNVAERVYESAHDEVKRAAAEEGWIAPNDDQSQSEKKTAEPAASKSEG